MTKLSRRNILFGGGSSLLASTIVGVCGAVLALVWITQLFGVDPGRSATHTPQPVNAPVVFQRLTGWSMPTGATVVRADDDHESGIIGATEGDLIIMLRVGRPEVEAWIKAGPPWGGAWARAVDPDIPENQTPTFSSSARVAARSRGPASMPWHNGDLLILDPATGEVFLRSWDY